MCNQRSQTGYIMDLILQDTECLQLALQRVNLRRL